MVDPLSIYRSGAPIISVDGSVLQRQRNQIPHQTACNRVSSEAKRRKSIHVTLK